VRSASDRRRTTGLGHRIAAAAATAIVACTVAASSSGRLPLEWVADVRLPGNATRFDYQSIDPNRRLLFAAHLGDGAVVVVDVSRRRVVGTIPALDSVHGVLAVPQRGVVYASATGTNEVAVIDERRLKIVARIKGGIYPDGMAFDPRTNRLFVSDERGRTETVIDARSNRWIATLPLGGEAGNSQYDPPSGHVFVNVQTSGDLVEIDPRSLSIVRRIPLSSTGCAGNHGLSIDPGYRRAFVACENSATLLLVDLRSGHIMKTWTIGEDPDVLALDTLRRRLYVASESGFVSIFGVSNPVKRLAQGFFAPAAHSVAVDPESHLLYFPLQNVSGSPLLRIVKSR
jgi:DNA-binding beta-propeller fold protein YncE